MEDEHPGREAHKICGVCGDRALGYNFNAVSCESCKAFFRRNALKNKDFRCPFTENCDITPVTRRFCQKCRLDKCFSIGMRKEYIMSEEDKVLKRQKIEQNRAKKRPQSENPKVPKMKKEGIDDNNFDNDTTMSVTSVASVASVVGESYIWELDRKYTDLDASRHAMVDNMSPVTAASVPSPSSPPESANITGSKTLEMLKDAKYNQSDINLEERLSNQARIDSISPSLMKFDNLSHNTSSTENTLTTVKFNQNLSSFEATFHNSDSSQKYTMVDTSSCDSLRFDANKISEQPKISPIFTDCSTKAIPEPCSRLIAQVDSQMSMEKSPICEKPNETGSKGSDSISKFMEDPSFLVKFLSNPNMVAKIFQDQGLITKILTDSDTINRLASDPQISQFFEENNVSSVKDRQDSGKVKAEFEDTLANNGISDNMIRDMLEADQKEIENPILTNLITNRQCKTQQGEVQPNIGSNILTKPMEDVTKDVLQDVQRIPVAANSIESILCEAIKLEFSAYSALGGSQNSRELNDAERAKLNELIVANKALLAPLDDDITNLVGDDCRFKGNSGQSDPVLLDVINLTAIAIRRLIKMSKKINAFKNMCQEDQLALLKGGCTEMMILRSAINYDPDREIWKIPHSQERMSNIKVDVLKEAKGNLYAEHARFVRTFDPRWRDENIILILSAIALFTPDRPRVVHSDVIKLEQNSYYYLLRRYLESVYPGCEAKSTFLKLIQKISELHRLNNEVVGVYLNVNPSSVEPLLIEIFDLKH